MGLLSAAPHFAYENSVTVIGMGPCRQPYADYGIACSHLQSECL